MYARHILSIENLLIKGVAFEIIVVAMCGVAWGSSCNVS